MSDEKSKYEFLPIPTYEEATSSRPSSSQSRLGSEEVSDDAERQGLLSRGAGERQEPRYPGNYQPPTVESARSSLDFLPSSNGSSVRGSTEELRRELEQMDVEEPDENSSSSSFSKRFTHFRRTLSAIHLPLWKYVPKFSFAKPQFLREVVSRLEHQHCIIILRMIGLFIVVTIVYFLIVSDVVSFTRPINLGQMYEPESVRIYVQSHINESYIAENLEMITKFPHVAGTEGNYVLAQWVEDKFRSAYMDDVAMEQFDVYLNYPKDGGRRVAIVDPPELAWEAKLDEEQSYSGAPRKQYPVFHGHSKSGNVTGPLIYANYGSQEDFKALAGMGVKLEGSIVLVRYYGTQGDRALKVKAAELAGAAGCIIYSDPAQDGFLLGPEWPNGRYMPSDGVQRGGVSMMSWVVGDVLSPGFASSPGEKKRIPLDDSPALPKIPSIPIAWRDAQPLLKALQGHGKKVPKEWVGGVPEIKEWWSGDPSSPKVNLVNIQDEVERQPIFNVIGKIIGIEQNEKKIIVGSHRDAWCFGAADPGSGTAVLLEVARVFGLLRSHGWRPLRTIEFASWDGGEYNLIGSTEHVEKEADELRRNGFAYLNVNVAVSGNKFRAAASPVFERVLLRILKRTADPVTHQTLRSLWDQRGSKLEVLGAGSDYVAFQDIAGMSSIDFGFTGDPYPYNSCYDNFDWMSQVGDPGFQYHKVLGQIWALLLLELSDNPIFPFDLQNYADAVTKYVSDLEEYSKSKHVSSRGARADAKTSGDIDQNSHPNAVNMQPLHDAAKTFRERAARFHRWGYGWNRTVASSDGYESNVMAIKRMSYNSHMTYFETNLLDLENDGGIPNRTQFKHVIFGPQAWSGNDETSFPAIRDAIDSGDWTEAQKWIEKISRIITDASIALN
ncbi:glutamate carboxypeptidase [Histoplasma capsulatum G186AR]|uniref:Glutamate carboxypeptidase n=2 Tax=Ajellomyces capsulatus TaxID=5037 RepID=C0NUW0_AJECG|nr:glutamate carboxypeptidase [Histoplasma capsulatum G186AR]EEH04773.1 glutamate carboxypeptidase [Histoplasma capsulatum G186AR]KAG5287426.1 glutamate carboxypeptidase [Histoplasma capsulatum]QSS70762.1 glutamate carboxypeptidase [Histoplasma capsulatum G186AR]